MYALLPVACGMREKPLTQQKEKEREWQAAWQSSYKCLAIKFALQSKISEATLASDHQPKQHDEKLNLLD